MLQRDELLRLARIIDYNRYFTPSMEMINNPLFEYEYVQAAIHKSLDTYGYCITWQEWKKAQKNSAYDPCLTETEIKRKMQHNEIRALKEMKTSELRTMLETLPLEFKFENGINVVVLPKLDGKQHEVYIKWSSTRNLYANQYALVPGNYEYQRWFKEEFNPFPREDWRYLLSLDEKAAVQADPTNELYKYFKGVYTEDIEFRLKKGTEIYTEEFGILSSEKTVKPVTNPKKKRIKSKPPFKLCCNEEGQKMVCIKDPKNGNIIRINKFFTGKFIKNGFTYVSKEEYKLQQKINYEKRKDMSEGNREAQLLKYKGPRSERRNTKKRGIAGSPYARFQTIKMETIDKKDPTLIAQETIQVKRIVPQYEYKPIVWEIWEYKTKMRVNSKGILEEHRWKDKLIETIPFLNEKGEPLKRKHFIENKETWITIVRDVPVQRKTIKVLQIPSEKAILLKSAMSEVNFAKREDATLLLPVIRSQRTKHLLSEDKNGNLRLDKVYLAKENVKRPEYKTYLVTKRDSFGKVVNIVKRKLAK